MKRLNIFLLAYFILIASTFINLNAQVEEDSLVTELNSLLNTDVVEEQNISSASKYDQSPEEAPSSISIITSEEIEAYGYESLTDALNAQNGFYLSNDRSSVYVGVRGFRRPFDNNNRILLLLDGVRLNGYQVDNAPMSLNISDYERIEIVRGPGSTLYGNNAVHAVINLIPKKKIDSVIPIITAKYGSYNDHFASIQAGKKISDKFSFYINGKYNRSAGEDLYFKEYDTPDNNNGLAVNKDRYNSFDLFAQLNYSNIKLSAFVNGDEKTIPTGRFFTSFNSDQNQYVDKTIIDLKWTPRISYDKFVSANVTFDKTSYGANLPFDFLADDIEFKGNTTTLSGEGQFIWDILPNNRLITGIEYVNNFESKYKYFTGTVDFVNDEWPYEIFSIFFQNEFQYNANLSLYFGLRRDDFIGQETAYNPRAGVVYTPFQYNTLKLLYGRSFRAPNLLERNLEEKNIIGFKKNDNLKSEFINTIELIWINSSINKLTSSLSLYYYNMDGLIDQITDPVDDLLQYVNLREVKAFGAEAELNYKLGKTGNTSLRYSYQHARDGNSKILTNSPEHLLKFSIRNHIVNKLNGSLEIFYETKRETKNGSFTNPILLSNVNFYSDRILNYFVLSFKINNIFNYTITHPAGSELVQNTIIQPYRNYLFSIKFQF